MPRSPLPTHSPDLWLSNSITSISDFSSRCTSPALLRQTMTANGAPTICLLLICETDCLEIWPTLEAVVGSSKFKPDKHAFEFAMISDYKQHSFVSELVQQLRPVQNQSFEGNQVVAVRYGRELSPIHNSALFPSNEDSWGDGEAGFGKFVVTLDSRSW